MHQIGSFSQKKNYFSGGDNLPRPLSNMEGTFLTTSHLSWPSPIPVAWFWLRLCIAIKLCISNRHVAYRFHTSTL